MPLRLGLALALTTTLLGAGPARAQEATEAREPPEETEGARILEEPGHRLEWTYPVFSPAEYVVTAALPITYRTVDYNLRSPDEPRWDGDNAFDDAVEALIGDNTHDTRQTLDLISTVTWRFAQVFPFVDSIAVGLLDDFNLHVAWQMTMINVGAFALQALVTLTLHRTTARNRPYTDQCIRDGGEPESCFVDNTKSFPSGHASSAFTGAGLVCAHHTALPLYGGNAADVTACVTMLGLATATGALRIAADKHHTLDVLASVVLGLGSGWFLPWLLHYRYPTTAGDGDGDTDEDGGGGPVLTVLPRVEDRGGLGLSAVGWF